MGNIIQLEEDGQYLAASHVGDGIGFLGYNAVTLRQIKLHLHILLETNRHSTVQHLYKHKITQQT